MGQNATLGTPVRVTIIRCRSSLIEALKGFYRTGERCGSPVPAYFRTGRRPNNHLYQRMDGKGIIGQTDEGESIQGDDGFVEICRGNAVMGRVKKLVWQWSIRKTGTQPEERTGRGVFR